MTDTPLDAAVALLPPPGSRAVLALAGPPAAGKSTLARRLVRELDDRYGPGTAGYVPLDGFHLSNAQLDRLGVADRKGAPFTFDVDGYLALLRRLLTEPGQPIYVPDYDRTLHEPIAARHVVAPGTRLVITEGNYLASREPKWRLVSELVTELWYVAAPPDVRHERLVRRQLDGGRSPADARAWVRDNDDLNGEFVAADRSRCARTVRGDTVDRIAGDPERHGHTHSLPSRLDRWFRPGAVGQPSGCRSRRTGRRPY